MKEVTSGHTSTETSDPRFALAALLIGAATALTLLAVHFGGVRTNFEDAASLGAETTTVVAVAAEHRIQCADSRDAEGCLAGARARKAVRSALWLGNSQVHSVNQWQPGETTGVPILFDLLKPRGLDLLTFSQANASLQEHYVLFEHLRRQLPLRVVILPLVFDDLREEGLRSEVAEFARDEATAAELSKTEIGRRLAAAARVALKGEAAGETAGLAGTAQEQAEQGLTGWLDRHSTLWQARSEIRGRLFVGLYQLRNTIFGINPSTKRRMIPGRYRANLAALEAILNSAARGGIKVVLYVAPLRGGVEMPYIEDEYAVFKSEVERMADRPGVVFSNLEGLVPDELWGTKDSTLLGGGQELDFMHFRFGGHRLLAARLNGLVATSMEGDQQ